MRKNCNLELQLFPPSLSDLRPIMEAEASESPEQQQQEREQHRQQQQQQQQPQHALTIFYDGKICVSDVTELQAKSILMVANKEMEKRVMTRSGSSEPSSPILLQSPHNYNMYSPSSSSSTGLSMKRSLQRFLQKRKNRVQETSPYHH